GDQRLVEDVASGQAGDVGAARDLSRQAGCDREKRHLYRERADWLLPPTRPYPPFPCNRFLHGPTWFASCLNSAQKYRVGGMIVLLVSLTVIDSIIYPACSSCGTGWAIPTGASDLSACGPGTRHVSNP